MYLPAGQGWYDMYTSKYYEGGQHLTTPAPYERMPLFAKEGSIIPFGPALQYASEKPSDDITLFVYTGKDASFNLYEDEGINYNYEKGKFFNIPISYNESAKTLTIGKCTGDFAGMLKNKIFKIVWITHNKRTQQDFSAPPDTAISYNGNEQTIKMNINN